LSLKVIFRSNPKCSTFWYKNGSEIVSDNKNIQILEKADSNCLEINNCSSSDFGFYTFAAKGQNSVILSTCYVEIPPKKSNLFLCFNSKYNSYKYRLEDSEEEDSEILKPSIVQKFKPRVDIKENERLFLEVRAIGFPNPQVSHLNL
jgi:hypothetical protein